MKTEFLPKLVSALGFALLMLNANAASHAVKEQSIDETERETIYVEYRENHNDQYVRGFNAMNYEMDSYHYFKSNFENAFTDQGLPANFKFSRFPIKAPEGAKILRITYLGLESFGPVEVQLRMWTSLKEGDKETDYGIQLVRHSPRALPSSTYIDRDINAIYAKAAEKVIEELKKTIFAGE